jgi:catechol 2,3-dioxygenase-like lactoylglutathione lyase family enzyme
MLLLITLQKFINLATGLSTRFFSLTKGILTEKKLPIMHNMGIVVESLDDTIAFFTEIGLKLEGRAMIEGEWAGRITGLGDQSVEIAMMVTPDGHGRLELSRFLRPAVITDHRNAPVNALGYLRVMFTVDNLDELLGRLSKLGTKLVDQVVQYENAYRLCYVRGPEGILVGLAEEIGKR